VDANEVVVTAKYQSIGYTISANFLFTVKDGLIVAWEMGY